MTTDPATQEQIATLQRQIAAMQQALFSGATRVSYDGRSVEFASTEDLRFRLSLAQDAVNKLINPNYRRPQVGLATYSKGYRPNLCGYGYWRGY